MQQLAAVLDAEVGLDFELVGLAQGFPEDDDLRDSTFLSEAIGRCSRTAFRGCAYRPWVRSSALGKVVVVKVGLQAVTAVEPQLVYTAV